MFNARCAAALLFSSLVWLASAGVAFDVASIKLNTGRGEVNNRRAPGKVRIEPLVQRLKFKC